MQSLKLTATAFASRVVTEMALSLERHHSVVVTAPRTVAATTACLGLLTAGLETKFAAVLASKFEAIL